MYIQDLIDEVNSGLPGITKKSDYRQHCKQAVEAVRRWALNEWLCIRYVVRCPLKMYGQILYSSSGKPKTELTLRYKGCGGTPVACGIAFYTPNEQLYAGGSSCSGYDSWNKYVGLWRAITNAVPVPAEIKESLANTSQDAAYEALDPAYAAHVYEEAPAPFNWLNDQGFPRRARLATCEAIVSAAWCLKHKQEQMAEAVGT